MPALVVTFVTLGSLVLAAVLLASLSWRSGDGAAAQPTYRAAFTAVPGHGPAVRGVATLTPSALLLLTEQRDALTAWLQRDGRAYTWTVPAEEKEAVMEGTALLLDPADADVHCAAAAPLPASLAALVDSLEAVRDDPLCAETRLLGSKARLCFADSDFARPTALHLDHVRFDIAEWDEVDEVHFLGLADLDCPAASIDVPEVDEDSAKLAAAPQVAATGKTCLFLHGAGVEDTGAMTTSFDDYWGDIQKSTTQCSAHKFNHADTITRGWDDIELQKEYCAAATDGNEDGDVKIHNQIVFTHSMGNLILAGAILNGFCELDRDTSTWYSVSGPMDGAAMCDYLDDICQSTNAAVQLFVKWAAVCANGRGVQSYLSMATDHTDYTAVRHALRDRISGAMCGTTPAGLATTDAAGLVIAAEISNLDEYDNDGCVLFTECDVLDSEGSYASDPQSDFYKAKLNHADTTGRHGNGWFGSSRMPLTWYANRT